VSQFEITEKNLRQSLILGVQGRSKSSMLIKLKSPWPVLVMMNSMSVPIYNRFHTRRANNGKMTSFRGYPSLTPSFEGNPLTQGQKARVLGQPKVKIS